jgi:hypothetical protein
MADTQPLSDADVDAMRDVYMLPSQQAAYDRILAAARAAAVEVERLRGLQPDIPPRAPEGAGLPRYGLRWNSPSQPLAVPMDDGYWTPYHLAIRDSRTPIEAGEQLLWGWFGLSYASWLTLPRVLMHAMPDDWQGRMAVLLSEFDAAFPNMPEGHSTRVQVTVNGRLVPTPQWLSNYRRPDRHAIAQIRGPAPEVEHG